MILKFNLSRIIAPITPPLRLFALFLYTGKKLGICSKESLSDFSLVNHVSVNVITLTTSYNSLRKSFNFETFLFKGATKLQAKI